MLTDVLIGEYDGNPSASSGFASTVILNPIMPYAEVNLYILFETVNLNNKLLSIGFALLVPKCKIIANFR